MRKVISLAVLGVVVGSAMLAAGGCQTSGGPYGLTGQQQMSSAERMRYTDSKGHYRPEYAARGEQITPVPDRFD